MNEPVIHFSTVFMAFFAIMNPIANAPVFIGLTQGLEPSTKKGIAIRAVLLAFVITAVFAIFGQQIFSLFGITLPAFRIAGGIIVGLVGYKLLQGEQSSVHASTAEDSENSSEAALGIAISPLALPILAGPGTITTAMNFSAEGSVEALLRVLGALGLVCLLTWLTFRGSDRLVRFLGQNAIKVVSRLLGLILAVIGTQMLIEGIAGATAALS